MPTYKRIVIVTGAGVSAESGLATFRGEGGLWEGHRVEDVASPEAFLRSPELVQRFYNMRRRQLLDGINPNPAHYTLADFEERFTKQNGTFLLVTQNVDDLHDRAGSKNLIHMHGELLKARSTTSSKIVECRQDLKGTKYRPHIVWFGEMPFEMDKIYQELEKCDLFVAIGTSGHVYPAAGFVETAAHTQAHTVEINVEPGLQASSFNEQIIGVASTAVPNFLSTLLK
jgi:NAD-dependent deacetylase